jgi:hypothetical protein
MRKQHLSKQQRKEHKQRQRNRLMYSLRAAVSSQFKGGMRA